MHWVSWLGDDAELMTLPVRDCENAGTCGLQTQLSDGLMIPSSEEAIRDSTISGAFWHSADSQVRNWLRADRWASHLCQDKLRPGARTRKTSRIGWWRSLIIGQGALEDMPLIFWYHRHLLLVESSLWRKFYHFFEALLHLCSSIGGKQNPAYFPLFSSSWN